MMVLSPIQGHAGELAETCLLVNGSADLRLSDDTLPAFLSQAFKLAGTGQKEAAARLLTQENIVRVDALMADARPGRLIASVVLGLVWQQLGDLEKTQAYLSTAVAQEPNAAVYNMLANAYHFDGRVSDALAARARVLELEPDNIVIQGAYARDFMALGDFDEGLSRMEALRDQGLMTPTEHSNYLLYLHYHPKVTQERLVRAHRQWAEVHTPVRLARHSWPNDRDPQRKLRLGWLSADFHHHAASCAVQAMLDYRNHDTFEIYGYSNVAAPDEVTQRMASQMDVFRSIGALDDRALAEQIVADRIDILVAMSGHTGGHRLQALAYKPAPIQVDWGWINNTAIEQIDYRFTDRWFDPLPSEGHPADTLIRLPGGMSIFKPPQNAPDINPLPAQKNGFVTFGCSNSHLKINPFILERWARVLRGCSKARLVIKCLAGKDPAMQQRWQMEFARHGLDPERVTIMGWQDLKHYLEFYHQIDIALDTYPFNGCITTLEALWMGVPVISLAGPLWVSRMGLSLLANAGLKSFVAHNPDSFVTKAQALAAHPEALVRMRANMRHGLLAGSLFDGQRLARDMEAAYRAMWERWCGSPEG